jgi:uncharacterized protein YdiU (UPF0061 family)
MVEALAPLLTQDADELNAIAAEVVGTFRSTFNETYLSGLRRKIGLADARDDDVELMTELLDWMHEAKRDFTQTFRELGRLLRDGDDAQTNGARFDAWHARWRSRLGARDDAAVADGMDAVNPAYIPRNHVVEEVLAAAHDGDMEPFRTFLDVLRAPFEERPGADRYAAPAPKDFGPYRTFCGT